MLLPSGDHAALARGHVLHEDHGLAALERHIGQRLAVVRPGRRDDGLGAAEGRLRVFAVGIGDPQGAALAYLADVGDARGEHALLAGQQFVDGVGDAVRGQAQVGLRDQQALPGQVLALDGVPQPEAHVVAAIGQLGGRAGEQGIGALGAPVGERRARGFVDGGGAGVDTAEQAAALEIGLHDGRQRLRAAAVVAEGRDGDGDLRGAHAVDFDAELRARHAGREDGRSGAEHRASRGLPDG